MKEEAEREKRWKREIESQSERVRQKAAISCLLVLKEHIYPPLIPNALVNFLPLLIASTCDLSLVSCRTKGKAYSRSYQMKLLQPSTGRDVQQAP